VTERAKGAEERRKGAEIEGTSSSFKSRKKIVVVSAIVGTHCGTIAIMRKPRSRRLFHSRSLLFFLPSALPLFHSRIHLQPGDTGSLSRVAFVLEPTTTSIVRVIEKLQETNHRVLPWRALATDVKTYN